MGICLRVLIVVFHERACCYVQLYVQVILEEDVDGRTLRTGIRKHSISVFKR